MTLIEIMVVLLIIGGLAAVLGQTVFKNLSNSEVKQTKIQFKEVSKQLEMFSADCGHYPSTARAPSPRRPDSF
jgi:general secretion pathway protein G